MRRANAGKRAMGKGERERARATGEGTGKFVLEIGCEEIPARMIARAADEFRVLLEKHLATHALAQPGAVEVLGAPRRLAAVVREMRLRQPDKEVESVGPPKRVAFDDVGAPTRAAQSFAEKQGVRVNELQIAETPRGEYLVVRKAVRGRAANEVLAEILPQAIHELSFPRSMNWTTAKGTRFVRPIRWLVALLEGKVIPFAVGEVQSGRETRGHRFLSTHPVIALAKAGDYETRLRAGYVLVRPAERRERIENELARLGGQRRLRVRPDPELLDEVVYLNEYPTALMGEFDPVFLDLPEEILVTVMRDHQKYFAVETRGGELAPHFVAVTNLKPEAAESVRAGHERVLRARFADARFFWDTDQQCRLADYAPRLAGVVYASGLGTYLDKVERVRALARWIAEQWFNAGIAASDVSATDRAAELAKCDLVTEMVRELPELEGVVGGLYAAAQGESEEVAWAVYDQYRPAGIDDTVPRNLTGCALAMADRLDSLVGCFGVGLIPSGSSDAYGLRRAALGIVKILLERRVPFSLSAAIATAGGVLRGHQPKLEVSAKTETQVLDFVKERARYIFRERFGYAYDEIDAVLAAGADDLVDADQRISAVRAVRRTQNFEPLAVAFKRIRNILEKADRNEPRPEAVEPELFAEAAERALHEAAGAAAKEAGRLKRAAKYREALETIAGLRPAVDRFFDEVLVMAEDPAVRRNRLALLGRLLREFSTIADFSEIQTESGTH